ncbi:universal stress protein [uncultured Massilia sp.]|uniref:universal stress protein n=1 Tax=uncultured Massilia sp. TaxID=169973 RepID=UPI0025D14929|nr:universal stress protein [uncultured Massilia sp.]
MTLKSILVHVDLSRHAPARIRHAAGLARTHGAHLVGAAMTGIPGAVFPHGYDSLPGTLSASHYEPLVAHAQEAQRRFEDIAAEAGVSHAARLVCDQADDGLASMARFVDVVVCSQDDPDESMTDMAVRVPDYVILNSARPVLVLPNNDPPPAPSHVLLAWDGSKEASAAAGAAIPLLQRARSVTVATLTAGDMDAPRCRREQGDLLGYLGHHGVAAAAVARPAEATPGRQLLVLAAERGCNLLVMGCYGHGRLREICLGGASRTVLADARIPLLLAH